MKVSYKWLSQLVDLTSLEVKDVASLMTISGVEVENITYLAQANNLIIGEVKKCVMHPDSDHLHVCQVDVGDRTLQIVCGAPNCRAGLKVIVALVGAELPAKGITIQKGEIRGVESNGMMCSLSELGVDSKFLTPSELDGIQELPQDAPVGETNVLTYLGLDDVIFDIKPTPNRGDVLSMVSLAYEVAAVVNRPLLYKKEKISDIVETNTEYTANSSTPLCPAFAIKEVNGITIKQSPEWLKNILRSSNIRSVNNVVDIGNYVMLLLGQPLHMYDADKLPSKSFDVKADISGEFVALDNAKYLLEDKDIVVTSNGENVCLAGVMGAASTMIDDNTKNVVIEAAIFNDIQIRKTARRLQLLSDSSTRFIRGIDATRSNYALQLAAKLLVEMADASKVSKTVNYGINEKKLNPINVPVTKVNGVLGTSFTSEQISSALSRLSLDFSYENEVFTVNPPTYRPDLTCDADIIEEIIRILGFENLKSVYPLTETTGTLTAVQKKRRTLRSHLTAIGLNEGLSYSLVDDKMINDFCVFDSNKVAASTSIMMPLTLDHAIMRKSVVPSLLQAVNYNQSHKNNDVALFEMTNLYPKDKAIEHLGIVISGKLNLYKWRDNPVTDFYTLKGIVMSILDLFGIDPVRYSLTRVESDNIYYHPGRSAYLVSGKKVFGVFGQIHPNMEKKYDVEPTYAAELDLDYIFGLVTSRIKFATPNIYPSIKRDIAVIVKEDVFASNLIKTIKKSGKGIVGDVQVFDVYQGEHINAGYKSVAISIIYQNEKKTLLDSEVISAHEVILEALKKEYNATLRE